MDLGTRVVVSYKPDRRVRAFVDSVCREHRIVASGGGPDYWSDIEFEMPTVEERDRVIAELSSQIGDLDLSEVVKVRPFKT